MRTIYRQPQQIYPSLPGCPQLQREDTEPALFEISPTQVTQPQDNRQVLSQTPTEPVLVVPLLTRQFGGFFEIVGSTMTIS